jgi:hypothetical protein
MGQYSLPLLCHIKGQVADKFHVNKQDQISSVLNNQVQLNAHVNMLPMPSSFSGQLYYACQVADPIHLSVHAR